MTMREGQEAHNEQERELMDPNTWDWAKTEVGHTQGIPGAMIEVRFTRDEMLALNRIAQEAGIGPVEYTRRTMVQQITDKREAESFSIPERLAYWYFRLNGFMTTENFLVHHEIRSDPRTDVDILATRFAYRRENFVRPMIDDPRVAACQTFANIIIAEVKTGACSLNGPWTDPSRQNMERVLRSIGCTREDEVVLAAQSLRATGRWSNGHATVRLFALGEWPDGQLPIGLEQQIAWASVIDFCVDRFKKYRRQKASNRQWSPDGARLRELALANDIESIRSFFGLNPP